MISLHSHTHCQAVHANVKAKDCQRVVCLNTQPLNNAAKMKKLIRKINNKPPTRVTVAQLPLNSKKAKYSTSIHAF